MEAKHPSEVQVSQFTFSQPRQNSSGGQTIFINSPDRKPILVRVPKCKIPFGISKYNDRCSIQFSLGDNDEQMCFKKFLNDLDLRNVQEAVNSSTKWFQGKSLKADVVQNLYNPSMKHNNEKYPPMFRARFPTNERGNFIGTIYDSQNNVVSQDIIQSGCEASAIVQLTGIYFVAKEFGVSWKVVQLKVAPKTQLCGYSFLEESDDEKSDAEPN